MGRDPKLGRAREQRRAAETAEDAAVAEAASSDEDAGLEEDEEADDDDEEEDDDGWEEEGEDVSMRGEAAVWRAGVDGLPDGDELEHDPSAYDCLHAFQLEWPCLSFDIVRDELGDGRSRFPHALYLVAGSQADAAGGANTLTVARLTGVARTHRALRDDDEESDSDESDSEEEAAATGGGGARAKPKPTLAVRQLAHHGAVTRTRSCPTSPHVVATFSETGHVQVWDLSPQLASLAGDASASKKGGAKLGRAPPRHVFTGHAAEGYALDWSTPAPGRLLSGDSTGSIHLWEPAPGGRWAVGAALFRGHGSAAVEDVAWSPVEGGVFASVGCDGAACVWDVRQRSGPALRVVAHAGCDANCVAWSSLAPAMLATAAEDGSFKIWDLRSWGSGGSGSGGSGGSGGGVAPVASFSYHRGAVVSLQWAGFDASTIASAGEDDSVCVWDLAVERDAEEEAAALAEAGARGALPPPELPPQLMFVHQGQKEVKELRWHPQIPGLVVTTAAAGFMVWKPENQGGDNSAP